MAWGYWTAHTLIPSRSRPRSLSPGPIPIIRSRDHSLDRPSIAKHCHTPESGSGPRCGSSSIHSNHVSPGSHRDYHEHDSRETDWSSDEKPDRTKDRDRNTLPRVKMENDVIVSGGMVEQRHTLPRGRTECESHGWPEPGPGKASSEGDWCPGCQSGASGPSQPVSNVSSCRVSFHSVKDSSSAGGQTATSSDHDHHGQHHHHHHHRHHFHHSNDDDDTNDKEEKDLTSSSLPTPPPPPLQKLCNCGGTLPNISSDPVSTNSPLYSEDPPSHHHQSSTSLGLERDLSHQTFLRSSSSRLRRETEAQDKNPSTQVRKGIMRERESCSSRESHKSSSALSQRSSQDDVIVESARRTEESADFNTRLSQSQPSTLKYRHAKTDKDKEKNLHLTTEGKTTNVNFSKISRCSDDFSNEESRTNKSRGSCSVLSTTVEDLRKSKQETLKNSSVANERRSNNVYPSMARIEKVLGNDVGDDPIDFAALRNDIRQLEKDTIRRRQEFVKPKSNEIWADLKAGALSSGGDSLVSPAPAYTSVRSLTPEDADESTSFHESFEKDFRRRRRTRQRSASCSSRCCDDQCCRIDSCQSHSTHSVTGSSRSEKSSTRSSRSPSIEHIKQQGCNSTKCRARPNLC